MRHYRFLAVLTVCLCCVFCSQAGIGTAMIKGDSYEQRAGSVVELMASVEPKTPESIKYISPFYFARLLTGTKVEETNGRLLKMYESELSDPDAFYSSGSNMDFCVHATMHGYLVTGDKMSDSLRNAIRSFMEMGRYIRKNVTLNMRMMTECAGYMCAQVWPDFKDADGNDAERIRTSLRPGILSTIRGFITDNCPEADAFTYIGTNLQYLRMLAEFCTDSEVRSAAEKAYQHIIAQMLLPWNRGMYCSNPPRSKGWANLQTGCLSMQVQIGQLCWLLYGGQPERPVDMDIRNRDNFGCFNFWMAYPGNVTPDPMFEKICREKEYPHEFEATRRDKRYYYTHYTYQSDNYGLSTQHIEGWPDSLEGMQYTYAYKETRNLHLVWRSDSSPWSVFSVCHDNPERPQRYQKNPNKLGYGENPYHRVFGRGKSAIGMYVVPDDYMDNPCFYRMYVPFTRKGIVARQEKNIKGMRWVLCHTGDMMFAFTTPEEWMWDKEDGRFGIDGHDVLVLTDTLRRRGSWILETTEITDRYIDPGRDSEVELDRFARDIESKTEVCISEDYDTSLYPVVKYKGIDGVELEMEYFTPETPYAGQYRIDGNEVAINSDYISRSPYMEQKAGETRVLFHFSKGEIEYHLE